MIWILKNIFLRLRKTILINNTYFRIWLFLFILYISSGLSNAEDLHIRIPEKSKMHLYTPDNYTSLVSFIGRTQLNGLLFAISKKNILDEEIQWETSLLFVPDITERGKLPDVHFTGESSRKTLTIELNFFQKTEIVEAIKTIFGKNVAAKIGKQTFVFAKQGAITLESYRTGIECDRRYHYAHLVSFDSQKDLQASQASALSQNLSIPCF
jgi:hypothetical protein